MVEISSNDIKRLRPKLLLQTRLANIYILKTGQIYKEFNEKALKETIEEGINIEKNILESEHMTIDSRIITPKMIVYDDINSKQRKFFGYIINFAVGISLKERNRKMTYQEQLDIKLYERRHSTLESIVMSSKEIVFPDLLTTSNIFIHFENGIEQIRLIDFDGIQLGNNPSESISGILNFEYFDYLEEPMPLTWPKYSLIPEHKTLGYLLTKQADIKSLIYLFFDDTFNIELWNYFRTNQYESYLNELFAELNIINDPNLQDFMHKICILNKPNIDNTPLGNDIHYLAEHYELTFSENGCKKTLRKKQNYSSRYSN